MAFLVKRTTAPIADRSTAPTAPGPTTTAAPATTAAPSSPVSENPPSWGPRADGPTATVLRSIAGDGDFDGYFIGKNGVALPPTASLDAIAKILPKDVKSDGLGIFVNGVLNTAKDQAAAMEELANAAGLPLIGVHNATGGLRADVTQTIEEKLGIESNEKSISLLAKVIEDRLDKDQPLTLFGHSQGALIVSVALTRAKNDMIKRGDGQAVVEQKMNKLLKVETFATAASTYPDGPKYVHYINDADPVPRLFGTHDKAQSKPVPGWGTAIDNGLSKIGIKTTLGWGAAYETRHAIQKMQHPGRGAVVVHFRDDGKATAGDESMAAHRLATYLKHRLPFDEARQKFASNPSSVFFG